MKDMKTSFKAVLENLRDMQEFVDTALAEGYDLNSKFQDKKNPVGVFVKLAKRPKQLQHEDDKRPSRKKAYCHNCKQAVPVEWMSRDSDEQSDDDPMYSQHSVSAKDSLNPITCESSYMRVPDDINITL